MSRKNSKGELVKCKLSDNIHDGLHRIRTVRQTVRRVIYSGWRCVDCGKKSKAQVPIGKVLKGGMVLYDWDTHLM